GERVLHRARVRQDLDVLGAQLRHHQPADAEEQRIARGEHAHVVLAGQLLDPLERLAEAVLHRDALALELSEERQVALAAHQHLRAGDRVDRAAGQPRAAVVADADHRHCPSHALISVERSRSACTIATAMVEPPLRPRATMYGAPPPIAISFDSAAETKPT